MEKRIEKGMKRVVLTGPESTGKSSLAKRLSYEFNTLWIPEYARFYIASLKRDYTIQDVIHIAEQQIFLEEELALISNDYLFLDTDLIITKVWLKHVFNEVPGFIDEYIRKNPGHMHLLCDYDLPWVDDPTRENPDKRGFFFDWYRRELDYYGLDYHVIRGAGDVRFKNALMALNNGN